MALYTVHHSASAHVCTRTRFGDRAFAVAGTKVLLSYVNQTLNLDVLNDY